MKVREKHANGAEIELTGSGRAVKSALKEWREAQLPKPGKPEDEAPKMVGTSTTFLGGDDRRFEHGARSNFADMPVVYARLGFVSNEENWR